MPLTLIITNEVNEPYHPGNLGYPHPNVRNHVRKFKPLRKFKTCKEIPGHAIFFFNDPNFSPSCHCLFFIGKNNDIIFFATQVSQE